MLGFSTHRIIQDVTSTKALERWVLALVIEIKLDSMRIVLRCLSRNVAPKLVAAIRNS
jgi:hypothetical protein